MEGPNDQVVCIRKPQNGNPADPRYVQFPGGKKNPREHGPQETAKREVEEETGIPVPFSQLKLKATEQDFNHHHHPYKLHLYRTWPRLSQAQLDRRKAKGVEGEEILVFTWQELNAMDDFSPKHRALAEKHGLWKN